MAAAPYEQVMEDMLRGRDFAAQLQGLLRDSPKAGLIVDQILNAFSRAIDAAKAMATEEGSEVQSDVTCAGGGGGKRKAAAGGSGGDRGRASRRRTQTASVKTVTTKDLDDGHAWRKYGQKEIQNSKHPKAYFRCTHKFDQQCLAQRQVQRCDEAPETYRVTYIGAHTCRDPATVARVVLHHAGAEASALPAGSRLISFAPNGSTPATSTTTTTTTGNANQQADHPEGAVLLRPGSGLPPLKVEGVDQEEVLSSLTPAGSARNPVATPGPDQGDVTSDLQFFGDGIGEIFTMDDGTFDLEDIFRI